MARFFKLLILVPAGILILAFAIANRQTITVSFDPFSNPEASTAVVTAPLFILLFLALRSKSAACASRKPSMRQSRQVPTPSVSSSSRAALGTSRLPPAGR